MPQIVYFILLIFILTHQIRAQHSTVTKHDNIIVNDTVYIFHDPVVIDTTHVIYDTSLWHQLDFSFLSSFGYCQKSAPPKSLNSNADVFADLVERSSPYLNYSIESGISGNIKSWSSELTIGYNRYGEKNHFTPPGTPPLIDTLDIFYIIEGSDTIPQVVTDTTFFEPPFEAFSSQHQLSYLIFSFRIVKEFLSSSQLRPFVKTGITVHFLLNSKGFTIDPNDISQIINVEDYYHFRKRLTSLHFSAGFNYNISTRNTLFLESFYTPNFQSLWKEESLISKTLNPYGIKIGFYYSL